MNFSNFRITKHFIQNKNRKRNHLMKSSLNWCSSVMSQSCANKLDQYLKTALEKLKNNNYVNLNLVIGNESCDLDSAVSAVVYAAFLDWQYDKIKCCKVCTRFNRDGVAYIDDIYIPMLNVDREDYELKTEVAFCLRECGVKDDSLLFRNDINLNKLVSTSTSKVTLVDHHVLSKQDQFLAPHVSEIVDHRPVDRTQWSYPEDIRSTIEIVGSCCTLVAQRIKDLSALVASEGDFFTDYRNCCDLLHSTIILDTVNFSKEVDKATPHDEEAVLFLESVLQPSDVQAERKRKLDRLVAARGDVSLLSAAQLLRKDVKVLGDVLVPSFPILVKEFLSRPNAVQSVTEALRRRGCSLALLLGMDLSGGLKRDMAVWSPDRSRSQRLCEFLVSWQPSLDLLADKLPNTSDSELSECLYCTQRNLAASRKQYMPALTQFLNE